MSAVCATERFALDDGELLHDCGLVTVVMWL